MKIQQRPGIPTHRDETRSLAQSRTVVSLALVAICPGYFMVILDATIVNVVTPVLQTQLGTTRMAVQWVIDGYLLLFVSLLLTVGALRDHLGNKQAFLADFLS
jgi:MFS transporter, DHA2 family, methylenomycin A resistance protein